ncbi:MAG: trypsin-like serine protease [Spirochaetales bacterium]|nr:trypsin-like serine protease [Spirochaetales bacterium]
MKRKTNQKRKCKMVIVSLALLLALFFTGCNLDTGTKAIDDVTYPLPVDHPEAILQEDLSSLPEALVTGIGSDEILTGNAAIDAVIGYNINTKTASKMEFSSSDSKSTGNNVVESYISPYAPKAENSKSVFGSDDRTKITSTTSYPTSTYVKLIITFSNDEVYVGSGTMVGNKHVLTAGHCVYDTNHGGWAKHIKVIPGLAGTYQPFGYTWAEWLYPTSQWVDSRNYNYDIAVVRLSTKIGQNSGWQGYAWLKDSQTEDLNIKVYGYPAALSSGQYQYVSFGSVSSYNSGMMYTLTDWTGGQSGGPVISRGSSSNYCIGAISSHTSSTNRAVRITKDRFNWINDLKVAGGD